MMAKEVKETIENKFKTHHLVDWALLVTVLVVILLGAGYYLLNVIDETSISLSDTYRQSVVTPVSAENFDQTTDTDLKSIDQSMNQANPNAFGETSLNDSSVGL